MRKNSVNMPMSSAGIMTGSKEAINSRIQIRPTHVVILVIALVLVVTFMHLLF